MTKEMWITVGIAILLAVLLSVSGCATVSKDFTARTVASVNSSSGFTYDSSKNQENLKATGEMNKDGTLKFTIETTATTPEAAIVAAMASQAAAMKAFTDLVNMVMPLVSKGLVTPVK